MPKVVIEWILKPTANASSLLDVAVVPNFIETLSGIVGGIPARELKKIDM